MCVERENSGSCLSSRPSSKLAPRLQFLLFCSGQYTPLHNMLDMGKHITAHHKYIAFIVIHIDSILPWYPYFLFITIIGTASISTLGCCRWRIRKITQHNNIVVVFRTCISCSSWASIILFMVVTEVQFQYQWCSRCCFRCRFRFDTMEKVALLR